MKTGMKRGKKAIGLGLGILLELSALQVYAAVTEDLPPVSSGEEIEATEKISPTAESVNEIRSAESLRKPSPFLFRSLYG